MKIIKKSKKIIDKKTKLTNLNCSLSFKLGKLLISVKEFFLSEVFLDHLECFAISLAILMYLFFLMFILSQ